MKREAKKKFRERIERIRWHYYNADPCSCGEYHVDEFLTFEQWIALLVDEIPVINKQQLKEGLPLTVPRKSAIYLTKALDVVRDTRRVLDLLTISREEYENEIARIKLFCKDETPDCK